MDVVVWLVMDLWSSFLGVESLNLSWDYIVREVYTTLAKSTSTSVDVSIGTTKLNLLNTKLVKYYILLKFLKCFNFKNVFFFFGSFQN